MYNQIVVNLFYMMVADSSMVTKQTTPRELRWSQKTDPLPVRQMQIPVPKNTYAWQLNSPATIFSGDTSSPFDLGSRIRVFCEDVVRHCPEFGHIDPKRLLIGMTKARNSNPHGLQARVTPLRFTSGSLQETRGEVTYQIQRYFLDNTEFLYLVTFCLPRFLDQPFDEKLITIFHELYHISPKFDGDLRRHEGRYSLHSHSRHVYDQHMAELARAYLSQKPNPKIFEFLRLNFLQLQHRHGSIAGVVVPHPKIVPIQSKVAR